MSTMTSISNSDDLIDVRDVIERVEQLQAIREPGPVPEGILEDEDYETDQDSLFAELSTLEGLLDDLKGNGGDHQWNGDWYPVTLIRDTYFEDYAQQLAEDIGAVPSDYSWPASHIDWEAAADALQMDYTSVEFDGITYWTR